MRLGFLFGFQYYFRLKDVFIIVSLVSKGVFVVNFLKDIININKRLSHLSA
ncbi:hypothetical protein [Borrelia coriaceae]|uniref:hypothetical protein n=1 Tax=Borrelia coriaceae TaxID=144 RepID=UPI0004B1635C|nr:hypothetical protein [Borrelia coriaceae]